MNSHEVEGRIESKKDGYWSAFEHVDVTIVVADINGNIEFVNSFFEQASGYTKQEALGKPLDFLKSGTQPEEYYQHLWSTIKKGETWNGELHKKNKNGTLYWEKATITPQKNSKGEITSYIAVMQDISREKEIDSQLLSKKQLLNDIQSISRTGGWEYNLEEKSMYWTDELYRLHGFERLDTDYSDDLIPKSIECYPPEEAKKVTEAFEKCIKTGEPYRFTLRFINKEGRKMWVRTNAEAIKNKEGKVIRVLGAFKDVTEEVEREIALQDSKNQFQLVVNSFDDIVFIQDKNGKYKESYGKYLKNKKLIRFTTEKTADEIFGKEEGEIHKQAHKKAIKGEHVTYTWSVWMDNKLHYYETKLSPVINNGRIQSVLGVAREITDRVLLQEELTKTKTRLEYALEGTRAGAWDWNLLSDELVINERWAEMLGYSLQELLPHTIEMWKKLMHPTDLETALSIIEKNLNGELDTYDLLMRMKHKKGHWVWIHSRGAVFERDQDGKPVRMVGTHIDVSNFIEASKRLEESERKYRELFEKSSDALFISEDGQIKDCNKAMLELLKYDSKEEVLKLEVSDIAAPEMNGVRFVDDFDMMIKELPNQGHLRFEWDHIDQYGERVPTEVLMTYLSNENQAIRAYVVLRDIRKRKEAEKALVRSNEERGLLLAEIHHRVKNNLAVISGLIQLQMLNTDSEHDVELLSKSVNRIKSMALIHEQLYQSPNFSSISLAENIARQVKNIKQMYSSSNGPDIHFHLDMDDIKLGINQALPVGLLINEIVTNSYKHAFKNRDEGVITISLKEKENDVFLIIKDDGIGMNDNGWKGSGSLGRILIQNFLEQIEAKVDIETDDGVSYSIRFDKNILAK